MPERESKRLTRRGMLAVALRTANITAVGGRPTTAAPDPG